MVLQVHCAPHLSPDGVQSLSGQLLNRPFRWMLDKIQFQIMKEKPNEICSLCKTGLASFKYRTLWCYLKNKNNDLRLGKMLAYGFKLVLKHPQISEHSVWVLFIFYIE